MSKQATDNRPGGKSPSGLPLLYRQPSTLDSRRHAKSSIMSAPDYSFTRETNSLPLNAIEFIEAVKSYPIVFTNDENPLPVAIIGMEQKNFFVKADNSWQEGAYIPAYARQYPFIFFEEAQEKKFYLCVDEAAKNYSETTKKDAQRLYGEDGKPTKYTDSALKFCTEFYKHHIITRNFCKDLKDNKLLQPYQSEITLASGKKTKLSGFQMIDEKALNNLPNKTYLLFREKGWIPFIYLALASTSNWKNLISMEAKFTAGIPK